MVPPPASNAALDGFLARFDAFCRASGWPPVRLSRALFADDDRVAQIRSTRSDVGVKRLARAEAELSRLALEAGISLPAFVDKGESDPAGARPLENGARS